jgi:hypothetical protein
LAKHLLFFASGGIGGSTYIISDLAADVQDQQEMDVLHIVVLVLRVAFTLHFQDEQSARRGMHYPGHFHVEPYSLISTL